MPLAVHFKKSRTAALKACTNASQSKRVRMVPTSGNWIDPGHCHACDNQSHPRPKDSPSRLVPLPSRVTTTHPLRHIVSVRVPTTQPRTPQNLARMNTAARDQPHRQPCSPRLAPQQPSKELAIATSLYLVPFHLCTLLFSFSAYCCPVPALYLSLYLLRLVV